MLAEGSVSTVTPMLSPDLRLAVRALRQAPTFTLIAVLSLALGIGASTSVYALTFALFFAPPAGRRSAREPRPDLSTQGRAAGRARAVARRVRLLPRSRHRVHRTGQRRQRENDDRYRERLPAPGLHRLTELFHRARTSATHGSLLSPGRRHGRRSPPGRRLEPRLLAAAVRGRRSQHRRKLHDSLGSPYAIVGVAPPRLRGVERRLGPRHLRAHPCGLQRGRPREQEERTAGPHRPAQTRSHARGGAGRDDGPGPAGWSSADPDTNRGARLARLEVDEASTRKPGRARRGCRRSSRPPSRACS